MLGDLLVVRLTGALGATVDGLDLAQLSTEDFSAIRQLLNQYLVLVFRDQALAPAEHLELAKRFGRVQTHRYHADAAGPRPEMLVMKGHRAVADFWHVDETFEETPPSHAILRMVQCPEVGGDTLWANQYAAYDALSRHFRRLIADLSAVHVTPDRDQRATHPVVLKHPETGRPALYVNRQFTASIVGMSPAESRAVLDVLFGVSELPDHQCRHKWRPGDVAIWDNRCTQHRVAGDYSGFRHAERVAVIRS